MLWRDLKVVQVFGANTNVGKSVLSTLLCKTAERKAPGRVTYVKPVSTGSAEDADDACDIPSSVAMTSFFLQTERLVSHHQDSAD